MIDRLLLALYLASAVLAAFPDLLAVAHGQGAYEWELFNVGLARGEQRYAPVQIGLWLVSYCLGNAAFAAALHRSRLAAVGLVLAMLGLASFAYEALRLWTGHPYAVYANTAVVLVALAAGLLLVRRPRSERTG